MDISYKNRRLLIDSPIYKGNFGVVSLDSPGPLVPDKAKPKPKKGTTLIHDNNVGVYKIHCLINDKIYVGQSVNVKVRLKTHKHNLNKREYAKKQSDLQADWDKYGAENFAFELVHECESHFLLRWETYYIDYFAKAGHKLYNIVLNTEEPTILNVAKANMKVLRRIDRLLVENKIDIDQLDAMLDQIE